MNTILGIDPGVVGGWAVLNELGALIAADDLPVAGDGAQRMIAAPLLAHILSRYQPTTATLERVGSTPGQGVSSSFKFGRAVGVIEGVLGAGGCPVVYVAPATWKKHFRLGPEKEQARQRAIETWPDRAAELFGRKRDHGRGEAALIALWGLRASIVSGVHQ
jgi:Holliday junction resolvasome RuvABC endonuclease subunit